MDDSRRNHKEVHHKKPPLTEVSIGFDLAPLLDMRAEHIGRYWEHISSEFPKAQQAPTIGLPLDAPNEIFPMGRFWFISADDNYLVQVQRNKFYFIWRKVRPDDIYPKFSILKERFYRHLEDFRRFIADLQLGEIIINEFDLSYTNHITQESQWSSISDTKNIFPEFKMVGGALADFTPVDMDQLTVYQLPDERGKLSLRLRTARRIGTTEPILLAELSVKGRCHSQNKADITDWYEHAHECALHVFDGVIPVKTQEELWEREV